MNRTTSLVSVAVATLVSTVTPALATPNYAAEITGYSPGNGVVNGYQNPNSALGEPSRITPGEFGGAVDPFSAPWQADQLVSIGSGGSLTVRFQFPVLNLDGNPHGLDFLIFGNAAFLITNGDFSGGGITDGSLFGASTGPTRISVSADGTQFFTLDTALAPTVDAYFPTDGAGDPSRAIPPGVRDSDFNGLDLQGIRALYDGSAGGTAFDIGWALQPDGTPALLDAVQFVRVEVLGDKVEIDGFSAVPEPSSSTLLLLGTLVGLARLRARRPVSAHPGAAQ